MTLSPDHIVVLQLTDGDDRIGVQNNDAVAATRFHRLAVIGCAARTNYGLSDRLELRHERRHADDVNDALEVVSEHVKTHLSLNIR